MGPPKFECLYESLEEGQADSGSVADTETEEEEGPWVTESGEDEREQVSQLRHCAQVLGFGRAFQRGDQTYPDPVLWPGLRHRMRPTAISLKRQKALLSHKGKETWMSC